jgi:hypothetical protein
MDLPAFCCSRATTPSSNHGPLLSIFWPTRRKARRWKRRLNDAGQKDELHENGYWLLPFRLQADCPYLVGSCAEIGVKLRRFGEMNVSTIILDVDEQELDHVRKALASSGVF